MFVSQYFDKALEYGGLPKLVLVLKSDHLDNTWREVPADTPEELLSVLQETFPTVQPSTSGETLWLSRLSPDDPRRGPSYEGNYGRWIPGRSLDAIHALVIFGNASNWDAHL